jgi:hypothetical protein
MRPRLYEIVCRALETGVALGYQRAHKHTDQPDRADLFDAQVHAILECLDEVIAWDDDEV